MSDKADATHAKGKTYEGKRVTQKSSGYRVGDQSRQERIEAADPEGKGWFSR